MFKAFFKKILLPIVFAFLAVAAVYGSFLIWKILLTEKKINSNSDNSVLLINTIKNFKKGAEINLSGFEDGRINILLLGIPGELKGGTNLSDTLMVASVNTKTSQVALLSIPRDLYVEIPDTPGAQAKINTLYQHGLGLNKEDDQKAVEIIKGAVENITSLPIHYWVILNFKGFVEIIDSVGGININNEKDIYDSRYPGPGYSYVTFELPQGFHHLDGETALKYARMRHDSEGDFGRAKRQQQVIQTAKNKIFSVGTMLNALVIGDMLDTLGDNLRTNIRIDEIGDFLEMIKMADTHNINNVVIDAWNKDSLLIVSHVYYKDSRSFVLIPRIGNWEEVREISKNIFDINSLKKRREEIMVENARVAVINKSGNAIVANRIKNLLEENFNYKNAVVLAEIGTHQEKTIVYDLSGSAMPYTLDELAKKLPAEISSNLPESYKKTLGNIEADIVVIAGKDLIGKFGMEKGSLEEYNNSTE